MTTSQIELRGLEIAANIGTYQGDDVVPDAHILDLTLTISSDLVLIDRDDMDLVFDYDPLIAQIDKLARAQHYHTQERLMTLIVAACLHYPQVQAIDIAISKTPVLNKTGQLGVRLSLDLESVMKQRNRPM